MRVWTTSFLYSLLSIIRKRQFLVKSEERKVKSEKIRVQKETTTFLSKIVVSFWLLVLGLKCVQMFVMLLLAVPDFVCSHRTLTQNRPLRLVVLVVSSAGCTRTPIPCELRSVGKTHSN